MAMSSYSPVNPSMKGKLCELQTGKPWSLWKGVGRPGFHSLVESYYQTLKSWYSQLTCLTFSIVWRTNRVVRLLCPWARHNRDAFTLEPGWTSSNGNLTRKP